ncbi:MAG: hypothetical protein M9962_15535 [Oligoflexia bacterium]|nr:hypothetical protein [Oligoflexia bacterium]
MKTDQVLKALFSLFWICLIFLHIYRLYDVPGIHYDEAWSMNYSNTIKEGSSPWQGMSPFTSPWVQYYSANFFKIFSESFFIFRLSHVLLALLGLFFVNLSIKSISIRAYWLFPFSLILFSGSWMNHRFAIELTSLHVFLFGLLLLSLSRKNIVLSYLSWTIGISTHILFYPIGIAFILSALYLNYFSQKTRYIHTFFCLLVFGIFYKVFLEIPEKGKALTLLFSVIALAVLPWISFKLISKTKNLFEYMSLSLGGLTLFTGTLFSLGLWTLAITKGFDGSLTWLSLPLIPLIYLLFLRGAIHLPEFYRWSFFLLPILITLMTPKATPRYFCLIIITISALSTLGIVKNFDRWALSTLALLVALFSYTSATYFYSPVKENGQKFLWYKDSSRDFLPKQQIVSLLSRNACQLSDIKLFDSRVREALQALAIADWPIRGLACPWNPLAVVRKNDETLFSHVLVELENSGFAIGKVKK